MIGLRFSIQASRSSREPARKSRTCRSVVIWNSQCSSPQLYFLSENPSCTVSTSSNGCGMALRGSAEGRGRVREPTGQRRVRELSPQRRSGKAHPRAAGRAQ